MKIIVAGGGGYIGTKLTSMLVDYGYDVSVIDLFWFGNHLPKGIPFVQKDLRFCDCQDFEGADQVIFLAGLSNDPMAEFSPSANFAYNGALPSYLAYIAKRVGVKRFIYASSCSVYGYTENELYNENSPVTCEYPYGISKLQGERGVMQMADDSFSVISLRKGTVGGYSPRMRFDLIVNTMYKNAIRERSITVNNPSIWRPLLDVRDACLAYIRAIQIAPEVSGVFNIASGNFTVGQVGEIIKETVEKLIGGNVDLVIKNIEDYRNYKVTCQLAETQLGFRPKYNIEATVASLHENVDLSDDLDAHRFYNIKVFRNIDLDKNRAA